jgi:hypothetical protein
MIQLDNEQEVIVTIIAFAQDISIQQKKANEIVEEHE